MHCRNACKSNNTEKQQCFEPNAILLPLTHQLQETKPTASIHMLHVLHSQCNSEAICQSFLQKLNAQVAIAIVYLHVECHHLT